MGALGQGFFLIALSLGYSNLAVAEAAKDAPPIAAKKTPAPQSPAPAAPTRPPFPVVMPDPFAASHAGQSSGAGGGSYAPPPALYIPPPPVVHNSPAPLDSSPILPKRTLFGANKLKRSLYFNRQKTGHRIKAFFNPAAVVAPGQINESLLFLETLRAEASNDALIAKHEYETDLVAIETYRALHKQNEALFKRKVIPALDFEQSRVRLAKAEAKAEESKSRWEEYVIEGVITDYRLLETHGGDVSTVDLAKAYAQLWEARLQKVKSASAQAFSEWEYLNLAVQTMQGLLQKKVVSEEDLLKSKKDADEALIVLNLGRALVQQNTRQVEAAKENIKKAERFEKSQQAEVEGS